MVAGAVAVVVVPHLFQRNAAMLLHTQIKY